VDLKREVMQITKASCQRPDALPVAQPTVSKQWRELEVHSNDVISPSHPFWDHELLKEGTLFIYGFESASI